MTDKKESAVRDAIISAISAMVVASVLLALYAYQFYRALFVLGVGIFAFLGVLYYRYRLAWFYRRVVGACIGLILLFLSIPAFRAGGFLGQDSAFVLAIDSVGTGGFIALCVLCATALIVCALIEYLRDKSGTEKVRKRNVGPTKVKGQIPKSEQTDSKANIPTETSANNTAQVTLVVGNFDIQDFGPDQRRWFRHGLASFLGVEPSDVKIVDIDDGSVKVTLEIPERLVKALLIAVQNVDKHLAEAVRPFVVEALEVETEQWREPQGQKLEVGQTIGVADESPIIGHAEHVEIHYGEGERPGTEEKTKVPQEMVEKKAECLWPEVSLPPVGGVKVSEPFAGREEELKELAKAMTASKTIAAVVGMAGQGKSCLAGEWFKRGARPPEGIGLFWRKVYESGYTFDRFVDDLHFYLTGEHIDRQRVRTVEERAAMVEAMLREKPCWVVLDGVERWLNRWAAEPDAGVENLTVDDRAGQDATLDKFLKGACFWENGSRLLITMRAVPSALDESPPVRVGRKRQPDAKLEDLKEEEAVELLEKLGVKGEEAMKLEAVRAYGCHAYAVHVLGALIGDLYGGDVTKWREVNPLEGTKLEGLFQRIIEHRTEDLELLEHVACSVGPAPVEMLAEFSGQDEGEVRKTLVRLAKWQMAEFAGGSEAEQHTIVRQFMIKRMGDERVKELRRQIAAWWVERKVPARPTHIDEVRPLLKAVEHLLAAREPLDAMHIFFTKQSAESYYTVNQWLRVFGYLDESIRINRELIRAYVRAIEKEGRVELRNELAGCYNNRGIALETAGKLSEAIEDYGRAIEIYEKLVTKEDRLELRNDLAMCYNNQGNALRAVGKLSEAIENFGRATEIREQLVEKEGRLELRNDLATCYLNRGGALLIQGNLDGAIEDYDRAIEIYEKLVRKEGRLELRNDLAKSYIGRGLVLAKHNKLSEAIGDYGRAIEINEKLVDKEGRLELRNSLAMSYNNRGVALRAAGKLTEAIEDFGRAIEICKELVEKEGRRELRSDLEGSLFNRAIVHTQRKEWKQSRADIEKGGELLRGLIEEGQRHKIETFMKTAGFRCGFARELGGVRKAAEWANDAMRWFSDEAESDRLNEVLVRRAIGFADTVMGKAEELSKGGLDEELLERFVKTLKEVR